MVRVVCTESDAVVRESALRDSRKIAKFRLKPHWPVLESRNLMGYTLQF